MIRWLTENVKQRLFASSKDGYLVFYPHGPFKGYVVAEPSYQRVIVAWISGFTVFTLMTGAAAIAIGAAIGFADAMLSVIGLLDCLWYTILVRRLTKGLVALPFGIGFRFYARCTDEKRLWQQLLGGVIIVAVVGACMFLNPDAIRFSLVSGTAMLGLWAITAAVLLRVRQNSIKPCSASLGVPDAADTDSRTNQAIRAARRSGCRGCG
ncbi:MAG: hypothetical protein IID44_03165 [Planctomycetes bacterium]|nr:hypothetical protein [Planctomycetota bacterium]